jgi:hypothetical protein
MEIALLEGMSEMSQAVQVNDAAFDLGDLQATCDYFFLLYNTGDETIRNVTFETDSAAFVVKPSSMDSLAPHDGFGALPILRISAVHGLGASGIGVDEMMPMGTNSANLTISGTSEDDQETSLVVGLTVEAKIMDISLFNVGQEVDLSSPNGARSSTAGGLGFISRYINITEPSITNTGNVAINVTYYRDDKEIIEQQVLEPNASMDINMPVDDSSLVVLDSKTVYDHDKFLLGNDGKAYFFLDPGSM